MQLKNGSNTILEVGVPVTGSLTAGLSATATEVYEISPGGSLELPHGSSVIVDRARWSDLFLLPDGAELTLLEKR